MRLNFGLTGIIFGVVGVMLISIGQPIGILLFPLAVSFLATA